MSESQRSWFRQSTTVELDIAAPADAVFARLTDAEAFSGWNSTVSRVGGRIAVGETLELEVPSAPGRVFRPKVVSLEPGRSMVWAEGTAPFFRGERTFTLEPRGPNACRFRMTEVLAGLVLPLARGSLPDFGPIFDRYAEDLRVACGG